MLGTLPESLHKTVDTLWLKLTTSLLSRLGRSSAVGRVLASDEEAEALTLSSLMLSASAANKLSQSNHFSLQGPSETQSNPETFDRNGDFVERYSTAFLMQNILTELES